MFVLVLQLYKLIRHILLRYLLKRTCEVLNKYGIVYWVDFGTLLGLTRNNDIIWGDNDVDICIIQSIPHHALEMIEHDLYKYNLIIKKMDWSAYRIYFRFFKMNTFVDVYLNKDGGCDYIGATGENSNIAKSLIGNPKPITWNDTIIMTPEHIHDVLTWRYGEDYMIPKPGFKGRDSK